MASHSKAPVFFRALSILAVLLLWGISLLNGTVKALLLSVLRGQLLDENRTPLQTKYFGVPVLDHLIALLVAFFHHGTSGDDEAYKLFLLDAYSALQPAFIWLYVEAARPGMERGLLTRPIIFGLLWQCFGAAIALPLFYAAHLEWFDRRSSSATTFRVSDVPQAAAMPWSFAFGALLPTVVGMAPVWLDDDTAAAVASPAWRQTIVGFWQPDPVWVCLVQAGVAGIVARLRRRGDGKGKREGEGDTATAFRWVSVSYALGAVCSAAGHMHTIWRVMTSTSSSVNVARMYVPYPRAGPDGVEDIMVKGPWLFLQYDFLIIAFSSLTWACLVMTDAIPGMLSGLLKKILVISVLSCATVVFGPGTVVCAMLYTRECHLPVRRVKDT